MVAAATVRKRGKYTAPEPKHDTSGGQIQKGGPTAEALLLLPRAQIAEYRVNDKQCKSARQRIYGINKNQAGKRVYRTWYDGRTMIVLWFAGDYFDANYRRKNKTSKAMAKKR